MLKETFRLRGKILRIGFPALVSRGSLAAWGIISIFIIRSLPEDAYAVYAIARSLEMFGALLGGGFIYQALLKLAAEGEGKREQQLANAGMVLALCFAVAAALMLTLGSSLVRSFYGSLDLTGIPELLAWVVISGTICLFPRTLLLTKHRTREVMLADLLSLAVRGGIIVVLLLTGSLNSAHQIFTALIVANSCAFLLNLWMARGLFAPRAGLGKGRFVQVMKFAVFSLGTALAGFIYSRTDILMLGKLAPVKDVSSYGACRSLTALAITVSAAANMILLPMVSRMWSSNQRKLVRKRLLSSLAIGEIILLPVAAALILFPKRILDLIFEGKYTDNWPILVILGALSLVRPLGSLFSSAASGMGRPQYSLYSVLLSALTNVVLNILLIPVMGGVGAALATAFAVVSGTILVVIMTNRHISKTV